MTLKPLPLSFYEQPILRVARQMLGQHLVRRSEAGLIVARIVEVEAYGGRLDPAAHSWRGPTPRCATMFGAAGRAYVYFIYGTHWCVNVVAGDRRLACAILIRGAEILEGREQARIARAARCPSATMRPRILAGQADAQLANGPGKLAACFALSQVHDGHDLCRGSQLWLTAGSPAQHVAWSPRVGLGKAASATWCWRAVDRDSTQVPPHPGPWHPRPTPSLAAARAQGLRAPPRTRTRSQRGARPR